jgi:hypothetical protein
VRAHGILAYHGGAKGAALSAHADGITDVLHVCAGDELTGGGEEASADAEVGVWAYFSVCFGVNSGHTWGIKESLFRVDFRGIS